MQSIVERRSRSVHTPNEPIGPDRICRTPDTVIKFLDMFRSVFSTFCAIWLFVSPCLCAAGLLQHEHCDCDHVARDSDHPAACYFQEQRSSGDHHRHHKHSHSHGDSDHQKYGHPDGNGSHDGCENDPCQAALTVKKSATARSIVVPESAPPPTSFVLSYLVNRSDSTSLGPPRVPGRNHPYFLADLPLLI